LERVVVTKRGKPVAVLTPPACAGRAVLKRTMSKSLFASFLQKKKILLS
jgi:antitoxin (DNA-binding transcriptional repressor) of toxin-antitoxin stability system